MAEPPPLRPATFQPRFTLSLFYLAVFFLLYCLILVAPELGSLARPASVAEEAALEEEANRVAREAIRPRLPIALVAALATVAIGGRTGVLPGLRPPR